MGFITHAINLKVGMMRVFISPLKQNRRYDIIAEEEHTFKFVLKLETRTSSKNGW